jgi:hypothetical protein
MIYQVTGEAGPKINWAAHGVDQVLQNVMMILTTPVGSVALDRDFGIDISLLDLPMPLAQNKMTADIFAKIKRFEPRFRVKEITYLQSVLEALDGRMIPRVLGEVVLT